MRFSSFIPAALVAVASLVSAQNSTCWKARDCQDPHWETKENLLSYGQKYCNDQQTFLYPPYENLGIGSAATIGQFPDSQVCFNALSDVVNACHGNSNGGYATFGGDDKEMRFSSFIPATLFAVVSLVSAQESTCWKARNCATPHWETKDKLLTFGKNYCQRMVDNPIPLFEDFGLASVASTSAFDEVEKCNQLFTGIVNDCFGKANGGYANEFESSTRLYLSFGDCEKL
ncbi:hypothetical protein H0H87_012005 [Tephrocybe sp. NHM501043]|nr:hypothetical protein H0H87_012005 [Tephrocybe sp. NHM501043]